MKFKNLLKRSVFEFVYLLKLNKYVTFQVLEFRAIFNKHFSCSDSQISHTFLTVQLSMFEVKKKLRLNEIANEKECFPKKKKMIEVKKNKKNVFIINIHNEVAFAYISFPARDDCLIK